MKKKKRKNEDEEEKKETFALFPLYFSRHNI